MSDVSRVVGSEDAAEQPVRREWSPESGWSTVRSWKGVYDAVEAKANEFANLTSGADGISLIQNGKAGEMELRTVDDSGSGTGGSVTEANATWELLLNDLYKPTRNHPYHATTDATTLNEYILADEAVRKGTVYSPTTDKAKVFLAALRSGITDVPVAAPVVRKTLIVSHRNQIEPTFTGAFTVKTSATVYALIPTNFLWRSCISPTGIFTAYEWLQKLPTFRQIGKARFAVGIEYWGASKWVKFYYSGGTDDLDTGL